MYYFSYFLLRILISQQNNVTITKGKSTYTFLSLFSWNRDVYKIARHILRDGIYANQLSQQWLETKKRNLSLIHLFLCKTFRYSFIFILSLNRSYLLFAKMFWENVFQYLFIIIKFLHHFSTQEKQKKNS